jgi:hypothetical protein
MEYNPDKMIKKCHVCGKELKENEGTFIVFLGAMCKNCYEETIAMWKKEQRRYTNAKNSSVCK